MGEQWWKKKGKKDTKHPYITYVRKKRRIHEIKGAEGTPRRGQQEE